MIFQHTWEWIVDKSPHTGKPKTQTRRLAGMGWRFCGTGYALGDENDRAKYEIGRVHVVQPKFGAKALARIRVMNIGLEDVRQISDADIMMEGFNSYSAFMRTWCSMHDKKAVSRWDNSRYVMSKWLSLHHMNEDLKDYLFTERPAARYRAAVLTFELVA